jgi:hypothetical protein
MSITEFSLRVPMFQTRPFCDQSHTQDYRSATNPHFLPGGFKRFVITVV